MQSLSRQTPERDEKSASVNSAPDEASAARGKLAEGRTAGRPTDEVGTLHAADQPARATDVASSDDALSQDEALDLFEDEEPYLERAAAEAAPASTTIAAPDIIRKIGPRPHNVPRDEFTNSVIENFPPQEVPPPITVPRNTRRIAATGLIVLLSLVAVVQAVFLIRNMQTKPGCHSSRSGNRDRVGSIYAAGCCRLGERTGARRHAAVADAQSR